MYAAHGGALLQSLTSLMDADTAAGVDADADGHDYDDDGSDDNEGSEGGRRVYSRPPTFTPPRVTTVGAAVDLDLDTALDPSTQLKIATWRVQQLREELFSVDNRLGMSPLPASRGAALPRARARTQAAVAAAAAPPRPPFVRRGPTAGPHSVATFPTARALPGRGRGGGGGRGGGAGGGRGGHGGGRRPTTSTGGYSIMGDDSPY